MKSENNILVSIVIPLYNKEGVILRTLESVLNQSYSNLEVIVVNDGSTDSSTKNIAHISDERLSVVSKINGGVSSARNEGFYLAEGDYVLFLDADDTLYPNAVETLIKEAVENDMPNVICGGFSISNSGLVDNITFTNAYYTKDVAKHLFKGSFYLRMGNFIVKKSSLQFSRPFDDKYSFYEDMSFVLDLLAKNNVMVVSDIIMNYAKENGGLSIRPPSLAKDWTYAASFIKYGFYENLIIGTIAGRSLKLRLVNREYINCFSFVAKHNIYLIYTIISYVLRFIR